MNEVRRAIYDRLTGDATLTGLLSTPTAVFHQVAPADAATPFVVFHRQDGRPEHLYAGNEIQRDIWLVKAVDRGPSATRAEDIAARIQTLLADAPLNPVGRHHVACYRDADVDYPEADAGETYRHVGATWRVITQPA